MILYDYIAAARIDVADDALTDDFAFGRLIPQVPSAKAYFCLLRAGGGIEKRYTCDLYNAIRLVVMAAVPGEVG